MVFNLCCFIALENNLSCPIFCLDPKTILINLIVLLCLGKTFRWEKARSYKLLYFFNLFFTTVIYKFIQSQTCRKGKSLTFFIQGFKGFLVLPFHSFFAFVFSSSSRKWQDYSTYVFAVLKMFFMSHKNPSLKLHFFNLCFKSNL